MGALDGEARVSLGKRLSPLLRRWVALDSDYKSVLVAFLIILLVSLFGIEVPW